MVTIGGSPRVYSNCKGSHSDSASRFMPQNQWGLHVTTAPIGGSPLGCDVGRLQLQKRRVR